MTSDDTTWVGARPPTDPSAHDVQSPFTEQTLWGNFEGVTVRVCVGVLLDLLGVLEGEYDVDGEGEGTTIVRTTLFFKSTWREHQQKKRGVDARVAARGHLTHNESLLP